MPIVVKRIKKYFPGKEAYFVPALFDEGSQTEAMMYGSAADSELLRTIKL